MPETTPAERATAWFDGVEAHGVVECIDVRRAPERLRAAGWWVVQGDFEGRVRAWRFADVRRTGSDVPVTTGPWRGPTPGSWRSSLDEHAYVTAVQRVRERVRDGDVYQANLCRVMEAPLAVDEAGAGRLAAEEPDARALGRVLAAGNPAPYAGGVHVPAGAGVDPVWVVSASPELFLRVEGDLVTSGPIKGTAASTGGLTDKDRAENVMITDLVRNDLQHVSLPGSVEVTDLLGVERHPGLVHLVSTVQGRLVPEVADDPAGWSRLLEATYPPGSVSGAPKSSALEVIAELEPVPRGPYCGAFGWVEVDEDGSTRAELAVAIRTFWWERVGVRPEGVLRFGTGAGITWGSDPRAEWRETELKASRLVALASAQVPAPDDGDARLAR
ncbi:chorismate-binding protein [Cellulomonas soli]|uniref:Anthranilate synthase n=1 Tax=Cellulomonas soli TaxID=931535 RepID=A0A512PA36_9CELL|nr:chorismate-binding protein [Cellulomonas soli]NYI60553.1 para-aminobenzoate synthetase component 1 [Cellulomonas soli]GEP68068.1 anthranilate synthase [Cellulomonas soli]